MHKREKQYLQMLLLFLINEDLGIPLPLQRTIQIHRRGRAIRYNLFVQRTKPTQQKGFPLLSLMQNNFEKKFVFN